MARTFLNPAQCHLFTFSEGRFAKCVKQSLEFTRKNVFKQAFKPKAACGAAEKRVNVKHTFNAQSLRCPSFGALRTSYGSKTKTGLARSKTSLVFKCSQTTSQGTAKPARENVCRLPWRCTVRFCISVPCIVRDTSASCTTASALQAAAPPVCPPTPPRRWHALRPRPPRTRPCEWACQQTRGSWGGARQPAPPGVQQRQQPSSPAL